MRKLMIAGICGAAMMTGSAFAQTTQPQGGYSVKPIAAPSDNTSNNPHMRRDTTTGLSGGTVGMSREREKRLDPANNDGIRPNGQKY